MKLNIAQCLVHDDVALVQFRSDHDIPHDKLLERPRKTRSQRGSAIVEGHGDRISVRTWLIHQAGLRFPISPILKEVMARYRLTFMQVLMNFV